MPPVNDDFANATVLNPAGGTLQGDNTGATSDGANDPLVNLGYGIHTVWYKFAPTAVNRLLSIGTDAPSSGTPIVDSAIGVYSGTTLIGLTEIIVDDDSGPGFYSQVTNIILPANETIYVEVTGYDNATEGGFTLTWSFIVEYYCSAVPHINGGSSTTSVVSGAVRDTQVINIGTDGLGFATDPTPSFSIDGACIPPNGKYRLYVQFRWGGSGGSDSTRCYVVVKRNGLALLPYGRLPRSGTLAVNTPVWLEITDIVNPSGSGSWDFRLGPPCIPIVAGDIIDVCLSQDGGSYTRYPEVIQSKLVLVSTGGSNGPAIPILTSPLYPIGATNLSDSPSHVGSASLTTTDSGIVTTNNGDVYIAYNRMTPGSGANVEIVIDKYSGGSWSTFKSGSDIFTHATRKSYCVGLATDGTDLWIAYAVQDANLVNGYTLAAQKFWRVYCKKVTAGGTVTSLGGAINSRSDPTSPDAPLNDGDYGSGINIMLSPAGVPWIGFCGYNITGAERQPFLFYWDGAAWVNSNLSKPVNPHPTGTGYTVSEVYNVVPYHQVQFTFCHHNGVNEYPSAAYSVSYAWSNGAEHTYRFAEFYYQEFNGSVWSNQIIFDFPDYWPNKVDIFHDQTDVSGGHYVNSGHWSQGHSLTNDGTTVYFGASIGYKIDLDDGIWVIKLKADGTDFERAIEQSLGTMMQGPTGKGNGFVTGIQMAALSPGNIVAIATASSTSDYVLLLRDSGTGQGSMAISLSHNPVGYINHSNTQGRIFVKSGDVYVLTQGALNTMPWYEYLPWKLSANGSYLPYGVSITGNISMRWKQGRS